MSRLPVWYLRGLSCRCLLSALSSWLLQRAHSGLPFVACSAGSITCSLQQTVCPLCPAGNFSANTGQPVCEQCPIGKYSLDGSALCSECSPGYYQPAAGQTRCMECPLGKAINIAGQAACQVRQSASIFGFDVLCCIGLRARLFSRHNSDAQLSAVSRGQVQRSRAASRIAWLSRLPAWTIRKRPWSPAVQPVSSWPLRPCIRLSQLQCSFAYQYLLIPCHSSVLLAHKRTQPANRPATAAIPVDSL